MKSVLKFSIVLIAIVSHFQCWSQSISFSPPQELSELQEADGGSMDLGDIDSDGDLDLVIIGNGSVMSGGIRSTVYLNDGTGFFTEIEDAGLEDAFSGKVSFLDIDGDGDLDILVVASVSTWASASVYLNDGSGQFTAEGESGLRPSRSGGFSAGDVDLDGDLDIIITGKDYRYINESVVDEDFTELFLNDGSGNFVVSESQSFTPTSIGTVEFFDMDNDGDLDVISSGNTNDDTITTSVYSNDGTGVFTEVLNHGIAHIFGGGTSIADMDDDSDLDVLICGSESGSVSTACQLYMNDGSGVFSLNESTILPGISGASKLADLDNDGDQDAILFGLSPGIIGEIYENTGDNTFLEADTMYGSYLTSLTVGDIDGDDDMDFLVSGSTFDPLYPTSRTTRVFFNDFDSSNSISETIVAEVSVFPNPSADNVQLNASEIINQVIIRDLTGRLIEEYTFSVKNPEINVQALTAGTYVFQILTEQGTSSVRVVRQ